MWDQACGSCIKGRADGGNVRNRPVLIIFLHDFDGKVEHFATFSKKSRMFQHAKLKAVAGITSKRNDIEISDSLELIEIFRDHSHAVNQGRGRNPHVIRANQRPFCCEIAIDPPYCHEISRDHGRMA